MNLTKAEKVSFEAWLTKFYGEIPSGLMKENIFTETYRLTKIGEKEWESYSNPGFRPGLEISEEDLKRIRIPLADKCEEYRIFKASGGTWLLMGKFGNSYTILTSVAAFQLENIFGEYYEEVYYERIFS